MSVLHLKERQFAGRTWYRLVRGNGRVFAGALRSPEEASSRARQAGHTIAPEARP